MDTKTGMDTLRKIPQWAVVLLISVLYLGHVWLYKGFYVDDALITLRYLRQLINGNGLVYNLNEYVEGYSNFLWLMLIVPLGYLGVDLIFATKLLGLATLWLTWLIARRLPYGWTAPALLATYAPFAAWTAGG